MPEIRTVYLDANCFIALLSPRGYHRIRVIAELFKTIESGHLRAYTSAFTVAEVRIDDSPDSAIAPEEAQRVNDMFQSGAVRIVPVTEPIALRASYLGTNYPKLMPADAVHIATAERIGVDVLFTFDGEGVKGRRNPKRMLYYDDEIVPPGDAPAGQGKLRIAEPFVPMGEMFDQAQLAGQSSVDPPKMPPDELLPRTRRVLRAERRLASQPGQSP